MEFAGAPSDGVEPDVVVHHLFPFGFEKPVKQHHEGRDLSFGPLPVLSRKCIQGEDRYTHLPAGTNNGSNRFRAFFMPFDPIHEALFGPSSVAIHNNGHMSR